MPIGSYYFVISKNKAVKLLYRLLGTLDLHTHIRLKPVIIFLKKYLSGCQNSQIRFLELGCGNGVNAFESCKIAKELGVNFHYVGVDLSSRAINEANRVLSVGNNITSKIHFYQSDAIDFLKRYKGPFFDAILLIDIIEHIENPEKLLSLSRGLLRKNGIFVISVPTFLYPQFFGKHFATKIGHLIDGYSLLQLDNLFKKLDCQRVAHRYNTGVFCNIGCWLFYKKLNFNNKYFNFLRSIILYPFKFLDLYNSPRVSCSLFAVYKK